jgi:hypothetical protein
LRLSHRFTARRKTRFVVQNSVSLGKRAPFCTKLRAAVIEQEETEEAERRNNHWLRAEDGCDHVAKS